MVISPSVDSMKLIASPNNALTSLDSGILLVDAVVDAVGLEVSCVASSVGVGGRSLPLHLRIMLLKIYLLHNDLTSISEKFQLNRSSFKGAKSKILEI